MNFLDKGKTLHCKPVGVVISKRLSSVWVFMFEFFRISRRWTLPLEDFILRVLRYFLGAELLYLCLSISLSVRNRKHPTKYPFLSLFRILTLYHQELTVTAIY